MNKLKEFRKSKKLTQREMARKMNITLSMYEKVERGCAGASAAFMKRLKAAFSDADIELLFFSVGDNAVLSQAEKENAEEVLFDTV